MVSGKVNEDMLILGLDIGGSTTDSVILDGCEILAVSTVVADHPIAAAGGAVAKVLDTANLSIDKIDKLAVTGGGSRFIGETFLGLEVLKVDEITCIGLGGYTLTMTQEHDNIRDEAFIVNVGTGTAIVSVRNGGKDIRHCGGTAVGGGTLVGLGKLLLNVSSPHTIEKLARNGRLEMVDLTVGDITGGAVGRIPADATASHFAKLNDETQPEDIAIGLMNLVGQTIGIIAYFASQADRYNGPITFTGKVVKLQSVAQAIRRVFSIFNKEMIVPNLAEYATAIGAAKYAYTLTKESIRG